MLKKFSPFRLWKSGGDAYNQWRKVNYTTGDKPKRGPLGEALYPLSPFPTGQIGNCCGMYVFYGVSGDEEQFRDQLIKSEKKATPGEGRGPGAYFIALNRRQVEMYHKIITEEFGYEVVFGVHNSNYPESDKNHDILLYAKTPERSYNQRRDWKNAEFI